jgi:predicted ATPase with chaperone activity
MLFKIASASLIGIDAYLVDVEVDISFGIPGFITVGLPDASVRESKERVRAALKNCGYEFPSRKITINLAPADRRKEGSAFDLPISLGLPLIFPFLSASSRIWTFFLWKGSGIIFFWANWLWTEDSSQ